MHHDTNRVGIYANVPADMHGHCRHGILLSDSDFYLHK